MPQRIVFPYLPNVINIESFTYIWLIHYYHLPLIKLMVDISVNLYIPQVS
jgi:hypothetical protein